MRAIKKIIALATGATMLGATVMGAMAADLANYPEPFVTGCDFSGAIVVGDDAASSDTIGAVDITGRLAISGTTTESGSSSGISVSGDSWKVETSSKLLEIGENFTSIISAISEDELDALADGTFKSGKNSADYEQELRFSADSMILSYEEDTDNDVVGTFLTISNSAPILNYTLTFKTSAETDIETTSGNELDDFKDKTIVILGQEYTITKASYSSGTDIELTLMGGAVTDMLEQGQIKTYNVDGKDYEVEVTYIGGTTSAVKFKVNGETTDSMAASETFTLKDGTDIGVREILEEEAGEVTADQVEFYLGASKIVLADTDVTSEATTGTLDVGDDRMDEVVINIGASNTSSVLQWNSLTLIYTADDDYWFGAGEKLSEKIEQPESLLNWDVLFEGMTEADTEQIDITSSGDERLVLSAEVTDGKVDIPLAYSDNATHLRLGDANDRLVLSRATNVSKDQYFFLTTGSGVPAAVGEKSYVLQYRGADSSTGDTTATVKFKNMATGETISRTHTIGGTSTLNLGGEEFTITPTSSDAAATDDFGIAITGGATQGYLVTDGGALVYIIDVDGESDDNYTDPINVSVVEVDADMLEGGATRQTTVVTSITGGTASEIAVSEPEGVTFVTNPDDNDIQTAMTDYGTMVKFTTVSSAPDEVEMAWPKKQLVGQAFVISGEVASTVTGTGTGTAVCPVDIPAAVLASEVASASAQNMILVGGPCANEVAAEVMGVAMTYPECAAGFAEGKAMIKLYEQSTGKVAMLVAGMTAMDTRRAARVLKNYEDYATELTGDEVEVVGTSLTDISVNSPQ